MKLTMPPPATVKRPQRPDYPEPGCRGYMRERARMTLVLAAGNRPDRPRVVRRKNTLHSTHWTLPARRANTLARLQLRRMT